MLFFEWKESYEIGVQKIDDQHRQLVALINELADAMKFKEGHSVLDVVLDSLTDYVQFHFTSEEELMYEKGYPDLNEHRQEHLEITKRVIGFNKSFTKEDHIELSNFLGFLCDWLITHLSGSDNKVGEHIKTTEG